MFKGAIARPVTAQTLARKGWAGSGIGVEPWWHNAVFYEVEGDTGFQEVLARLDYLQSLGVDAIVLSPLLSLRGDSVTSASGPDYGSDEDFDQLEQEASRRKMRLVIALDEDQPQALGDVEATARFWLTRGVGGLLLRFPQGKSGGAAAQQAQRISEVRKLCAKFAGERVVIAQTGSSMVALSSDPVPGPAGRRRRSGSVPARASRSVEQGADLVIDRRLDELQVWNALTLQAIIFGYPPAPRALLETQRSDGEPSWSTFLGAMDSSGRLAMAKMVAATLFLGQEAPLLHAGQEASPTEADEDSLLTWYQQLSRLRHERSALHHGSLHAVPTVYPDVVAWVRQAANEPPILVVCNTGAQTRPIFLAEALRQVRLSTANGVQVLAVSDAAMAKTYSPTGLTLPAHAVYVAELRQPGLEDAPVAQQVGHRPRRPRQRPHPSSR